LLVPTVVFSYSLLHRELNGIPIDDVESLLVSLILDGKLKGLIDQVKGVLVKEVSPVGGTTTEATAASSSDATKRIEMRNCEAIDQLTASLQGLTNSLTLHCGSNAMM